jgi:uncharacterized sulfatase
MPPKRPNILFFFTDQQRWDTAGVYGQPLEVTPHLDRMAREGVLFRRAFTCQPVCGPARSCLQTGKWATETGCFRNDIALPTGERTLAHWLSAAGYEVGYVGKWHLASTGPEESFRTRPVPPERRGGYDDFWLASDVLEFTSHAYDGHMFDGEGRRVEFPPGRYRADCLTDFAIEYLRSRERQRPLLLFISYIEPHHQNDHGRYEGPAGSGERFSEFVPPGDLSGREGDWREQFPDYLGCCHALDRNLGRLRGELEALGMAEDTLVVYASDHGSHFRTRNAEYKRSCHEASIRIPMVACGPGFRGGRVVEELVGLIDLPPTILTAGGADLPGHMHGRPLQDVADGAPDDWRTEVFFQISESQVGRGIRTERWKYSVTAPHRDGVRDAASDAYVEEHLYDLEADPFERENLVADAARAEVRAGLRERLKARMVEAGEAEPSIAPAAG